MISLCDTRTVVRFPKSKYPGKDQDGRAAETVRFANQVSLNFNVPVKKAT